MATATLTETQSRMLRAAERWTHEADGVHATTVGETSALRALARRGLVAFIGMGESVNCPGEHERVCYAITDAGRALLAEPVAKAATCEHCGLSLALCLCDDERMTGHDDEGTR